MQPLPTKHLRILAHVYAYQKASREMSGGILHYSSTHPGIQIRFYGPGTPWSHIDEFAKWEPDGIIIGGSDSRTVSAIENIGCRAAVFINTDGPEKCGLRHASIYCDNQAIAEAAANLFTKKKLKHFAYVGTRARDAWSIERGESFRRFAQPEQSTFASFDPPPTRIKNHSKELSDLALWLKGLPKPCGVFAACDARAKDVLDAAAESGIAIPEQLLVCGVDDEEFICRQTSPTLTSIIPDFPSGGYLAAEQLATLLSGGERRLARRHFGVKGIIERLSTCDASGANQMVLRAQEFIREHGVRDISVEDVAKASGASLRLLQKNFKSFTGGTVCAAIQSHRLSRACDLLRETTTPIGQIGELCGFSDEKHLKKIFRRRFGCTMREFRKSPSAVRSL